MQKRRVSLAELIKNNKEELLKDQQQLKKIEERIEAKRLSNQK